jgi:hypothetical protein
MRLALPVRRPSLQARRCPASQNSRSLTPAQNREDGNRYCLADGIALNGCLSLLVPRSGLNNGGPETQSAVSRGACSRLADGCGPKARALEGLSNAGSRTVALVQMVGQQRLRWLA